MVKSPSRHLSRVKKAAPAVIAKPTKPRGRPAKKIVVPLGSNGTNGSNGSGRIICNCGESLIGNWFINYAY